MLLLPSDKFQTVLENRFKQRFEEIEPMTEVEECFNLLDAWIDTDVYIKLLSMIDPPDFVGFQRFFSTCLRKHFDKDCKAVEDIKDHIKLQVICIACLQHYFM